MGKFETIKKYHLYSDFKEGENVIKHKPYIAATLSDSFRRIDDIVRKPLKLAVLGEFSAGKSTFINRLIGKDILPTGFIPVTSAITVLVYGEEEKIEVLFEGDNDYFITKVFMGYEKLQNYQKTQQKDDGILRVKEITVFVNNEILKDFRIIDTPGFNDANQMSQMTEDIFGEINYAIWLFNAKHFYTESEVIKLKEFSKQSQYTKNLYAVINMGDMIENTEEYDQNYKELLNNYKNEYFVNDKHMLVSSKDQGEFWKKKFGSFVEDLNKNILKMDTKISEEQLHQEVQNLQTYLETSKGKIEEWKKKITPFKFANDPYGIKEEIVKKISEGVKKTEDDIKASPAFQNKRLPSVLKFVSFYYTATNMEESKKQILDLYIEYISSLSDGFDKFKSDLNSYIELYEFSDNDFKVEINRRMDGISSNIQALQKSKRLLVVGYMIGLMSDDYVLNLLEKNIDIETSLNKETIGNLLEMDLDISYVESEILSLRGLIEEHAGDDIKYLGDALKKMAQALTLPEED